jgi:hypothetical protein
MDHPGNVSDGIHAKREQNRLIIVYPLEILSGKSG